MVLGHDTSDGQRTKDVKISGDIKFETMLLAPKTLKGLKNAGFYKPSPIQLHGIPLGKCGFDLLLEAKSGTGKTAVFTVIALEKIDLKMGIQAIVLAPTREIASQVQGVITEIGSSYKGLNVAVVMGGLPIQEDREKFKKNVHIVVGSPGRLRHLIHEKHIDVSSIRLLVLDEADKLMEKIFIADINYIFSLLPKLKQVIMCSATFPEETKSFINKYVQKAQHVCPDSNSVLIGIKQKVTVVPCHGNVIKQTDNRYKELKRILSHIQFKQCLIFCNFQVRVMELHRMLTKDNWPAEQLYGQQEQTDRLDALKTLQEYKCRILISTDLAARGIDASNVDLVVNFEPPFEWQTYMHRIGRAGRFGSYGTAINILSDGKELKRFRETLSGSNISFPLLYLWDDKPFVLEIGETVSISSAESEDESDKYQEPVPEPDSHTEATSIEVTNEDIWKALTSDSADLNGNKRDITTFEGLCKSFKQIYEPKIETFSDLILSFNENNKINASKDSSEYKNVKLYKLPTMISSQANNLPKKTVTDLVNREEIDKTKKQSANENVRKEKVNAEHESQESELSITVRNTEMSSKNNRNNRMNTIRSHICKSETENIIEDPILGDPKDLTSSDENNSDTSTKSDHKKVDEVERSLLEAGLPTAFGKNNQKYKKKYPAKQPNYLNCNNINKVNKPRLHQNKQLKSVKHYVPNKYDIEDTESDDSSEVSSETEDDETSSYAHTRHSHPEQYSSSEVQQRSEIFDSWYSQLKFQINYMQQALYFEELHKL